MTALKKMTEREHIEAAQKALALVKKHLAEVQKINAGNPAISNATYLTLQELGVWHGRATERLLTHFPNFGGDIVTQGGGGR